MNAQGNLRLNAKDLLNHPVSEECWIRLTNIFEDRVAVVCPGVRVAYCWIVESLPGDDFRYLFSGLAEDGRSVQLPVERFVLPLEYCAHWRAYFQAAELPFWQTFVLYGNDPDFNAKCVMAGDPALRFGEVPDHDLVEWAWSLEDYVTREFEDEEKG